MLWILLTFLTVWVPFVASADAASCACMPVFDEDGVDKKKLEMGRVCGTDGKSYDTACYANCSGAIPVYYGKCKSGASAAKLGPCKKCKDDYQPVCGSDGTVYNNPCAAKCVGVYVSSVGPCTNQTTKKSCDCKGPKGDFAPVCGKDGKTYGSQCAAQCAGVAVVGKGTCPWPKQSCNCSSDDRRAVCAKGRTEYRNLCFARCASKDPQLVHWGDCMGLSNVEKNNWMRRASYGVCANDGKYYTNMCQPKCFGASVVKQLGFDSDCEKFPKFTPPACAKTGCF